jgi:predicted negative regulator of RcsB-dependent stress response
MATTSKRFSRKELRQPDWFQTATEKSFELFARQRAKILAGLAVLLVIVALFGAWQLFRTRQNAEASQEFGNALSRYNAQQYREAIAAFEKVQSYRWSRYAALGHLYEANSYIGLGELDKAVGPAKRFLSATGPNTLYRQIALVTLATVQERQGDCQQALEALSEAERINGALQQEARLGKARCAEQIGDLSAAIASYRDYLKEEPDSLLGLRLAELETRSAQESRK